MLINHETLSPINVEQLTSNIFGASVHAKRLQSLSNAALGVISGASLVVHRIGHGLAEARDLLSKHAIKQVDRLLSNPKLKVWDMFTSWVPYIVSARKEIVVAMDWTEFDGDNHSTIAINLVTSHGRATPLLWKTVSKSDLKNKRNGYEDQLLRRLAELVDNDVNVTVLADRGFGDIKRYDFIDNELGFHYVIRFRGNINVTSETGECRKAKEWVAKNGRAKVLRNAKVTCANYEVPTVVCMKAKDMKEPWCIVSSEPEATGSILIKWYAKRWGIEPQFRDTKDIHFGMGLSNTRIKNCDRRDRLLLISALAVVILTLLGAAGEAIGLDRYLKANTVKKRTLSLFRQGCYYYGRLSRMKHDTLKNIIAKFSELVNQQKLLTDMLWVI